MMKRTLSIPMALALGLLLTSASAAEEGSPPVQPELSVPTVARAVITSGVVNHEPQDELEKVSADLDRVYCWTDVRGAKGQTVEHAWIHDGITKARVSIQIRADRWRCYSSKQLLPSWTGEWQVKVFTSDGRVLKTLHFTVE